MAHVEGDPVGLATATGSHGGIAPPPPVLWADKVAVSFVLKRLSLLFPYLPEPTPHLSQMSLLKSASFDPSPYMITAYVALVIGLSSCKCCYV